MSGVALSLGSIRVPKLIHHAGEQHYKLVTP
jgi:hypothetical protein